MGRTNPTFRDFLDRFEDRWTPMRRGLRHRYVDDFDRLFERAARHADAAGYANATTPERAVLLSILLAQETELRRLRERVDDLDGGGGSEGGDGADGDRQSSGTTGGRGRGG